MLNLPGPRYYVPLAVIVVALAVVSFLKSNNIFFWFAVAAILMATIFILVPTWNWVALFQDRNLRDALAIHAATIALVSIMFWLALCLPEEQPEWVMVPANVPICWLMGDILVYPMHYTAQVTNNTSESAAKIEYGIAQASIAALLLIFHFSNIFLLWVGYSVLFRTTRSRKTYLLKTCIELAVVIITGYIGFIFHMSYSLSHMRISIGF